MIPRRLDAEAGGEHGRDGVEQLSGVLGHRRAMGGGAKAQGHTELQRGLVAMSPSKFRGPGRMTTNGETLPPLS